jgi:3-phenylpropionate/cinnamic acid dioxygenase small subunit
MAELTELSQKESRYFTPSLYAGLRADSRWWSERSSLPDQRLRGECEAFLYLEARLLDDGRFEDWLGLYSDDCVYWVPQRPGGGDPECDVAIALDDRRRLEDRVVWLRSAYIWSQIPRSRTMRMISNVEVDSDDDGLIVRSNFVLHEARGPRHATHFGRYLHRIVTTGTEWQVRAKHVYLVESDQPHENMSILF